MSYGRIKDFERVDDSVVEAWNPLRCSISVRLRAQRKSRAWIHKHFGVKEALVAVQNVRLGGRSRLLRSRLLHRGMVSHTTRAS
jgi:hypothetical protein